jgi:peptidoglycan hydrolase-like protein with peptidoglycan-binding domain
MATGVIAVGVLIGYVLVGYLVNGPPQRPLMPRVVADTSSAAPSADRMPIGTTAAPTAAASPPAAAAPAEPDPRAAAAQIPTAEVREVQGRLRAMGFNPGPVDGSVGPLTENAAKQYQRARVGGDGRGRPQPARAGAPGECAAAALCEQHRGGPLATAERFQRFPRQPRQAVPALMVIWQVLIPDLFVLSALDIAAVDRISEPLTHD